MDAARSDWRLLCLEVVSVCLLSAYCTGAADVRPGLGAVATPSLTPVAPILAADGADVCVVGGAAARRDPTQPLFFNGSWHVWATHIPSRLGPSGYPGSVGYWFTDALGNLSAPWQFGGMAVTPSRTNGTFDAYGTFTPSIAHDAAAGTFFLFYGGVADGSAAHTESIGLATAPSPAGPWTRHASNPIVTPADVTWCRTSPPARVDEAEPYVVDGRHLLYVKGVCMNDTALPTVFVPSPGPGGVWEPPYEMLELPGVANPLVPASATGNARGFEQCRLWWGPDNRLHMSGNDHGDKRQPHFVAADATGLRWSPAGYLPPNSGEPAPASPVGAPPPGTSGADVPPFWIRFGGPRPLRVYLMNVTWESR